jgi:glyceraldehyde-3-phosphate dehydrogenase/erythrose-4-phosphate dehydrogenase
MAPLVKVLDQSFGIVKGTMTTTHPQRVSVVDMVLEISRDTTKEEVSDR